MVLKLKTKQKKMSRKRRHSEDETEYERIARVASTFTPAEGNEKKKQRALLPIKDESGVLINQFVEEEEASEAEVQHEEEEDDGKEEKNDLLQSPGAVIQSRKMQIAKICTNVINEPQNNVNELKKLQAMLTERLSPTVAAIVRKLAIASLTCVFTDIIPGYRIRARTEEEKTVKLSKDVRKLVEFEESLLHQYQTFLQSLETIIKGKINSKKNQFISNEQHGEIAVIAVKSLCELYEKTNHFNFNNNIVMVLVPLTNHQRKTISDLTCMSVKNLFRSDKSGESTLATIKVLCRLIKEQSGSKRGVRPEVLDTLLSLRINHVNFDSLPRKKTSQEKRKEAEERRKLSRGQLKHMKKQQKLKRELKETEAVEKSETKIKFHTEIIQQVFLVYFRILKQKKGQGRPEKLLDSVLEGLAQFAHLINVDFFSDLIIVLQNLISSGELTFRQNLCCISTAFKVLSGQGEALNIDPTEFYKHLYNALFDIVYSFDERRMQNNGNGVNSDLTMMLDCLNLMLNKRRKQVTLERLLAFIKRLSTLSMHLHPSSEVKKVLEAVIKLLQCHSKTGTLFEAETQEKGLYLPEMADPEHCGASSACLWELHSIRRHCCPDIARQSDKILKKAMLEQQQT